MNTQRSIFVGWGREKCCHALRLKKSTLVFKRTKAFWGFEIDNLDFLIGENCFSGPILHKKISWIGEKCTVVMREGFHFLWKVVKNGI